MSAGRIAALDVVRGIAVLGILAVNIAGFAGPQIAATTPHLPNPGGLLDEATFAFVFVLFEGKMRALFTLLFGASMALFLDRAEALGRDAAPLQMRRLGWLMLFGYLHFALLWWGDILFTYAFCGFFALLLRPLPTRQLVGLALAVFALYHAQGMAGSLPAVLAEERVAQGTASPEEYGSHAERIEGKLAWMDRDIAIYRSGWIDQVHEKLTERGFLPLAMALASFCEVLPLMLIGMALFRSGFFANRWARRHLQAMAALGLALGGGATVVALGWAWPRHFPPVAMNALLTAWMAFPHLFMALGYAALLMLGMPRLLETRLGDRLRAAGRMAFSNYIGTSLVMTAIFYGWGLGLLGTIGAAVQWLYVMLGWALMLAWSKPWLARFRQGPLEWAWRSLFEWRALPLLR